MIKSHRREMSQAMPVSRRRSGFQSIASAGARPAEIRRSADVIADGAKAPRRAVGNVGLPIDGELVHDINDFRPRSLGALVGRPLE